MNTLWMVLAAAIALTAAFYAQRRIGRHIADPRSALFMRALLGLLGAAFGYVAADNFRAAEGPALLAFLIGFGAVHVPAAVILLLKRAAGAGKS